MAAKVTGFLRTHRLHSIIRFLILFLRCVGNGFLSFLSNGFWVSYKYITRTRKMSILRPGKLMEQRIPYNVYFLCQDRIVLQMSQVDNFYGCLSSSQIEATPLSAWSQPSQSQASQSLQGISQASRQPFGEYRWHLKIYTLDVILKVCRIITWWLMETKLVTRELGIEIGKRKETERKK